MGRLALAAKITHVPSTHLSELGGPHQGCRQAAIDGHVESGRRCGALGVDGLVVFDVDGLVYSEYPVNCAPHFERVYTSNELPQMHDTAMLLGALGGERYDQRVEIITPYFGSSGTGQIHAISPVVPLAV